MGQRIKKDASSAMNYATRCVRWFRKHFDTSQYSRSDNIQWYFNFNVLDYRTPGSFVLSQTPGIDSAFLANVFYYQTRRHLLRS